MRGVLERSIIRGAGRPRRGLALALPLLLSACAGEHTGAVLTPAGVTVPAEAPRTTGRERGSDADH
ncbi:peptidase M48, partial [Methylobacterium sp. A54F]